MPFCMLRPRELPLVICFLAITFFSAVFCHDRHRSPDYGVLYDDPFASKAHTHTYPSIGQCMEVCEIACQVTSVHFPKEDINMYNCHRLKPPKAESFVSTLKGNSFYLTLFILAVIVIGIVCLLTMCFCCSYCCKQQSHHDNSRGSSKQALTQNAEDAEFKEYLTNGVNGTVKEVGNGALPQPSTGNGTGNGVHTAEDFSQLKREREFSRRPRIGAAHIV